MWDLFSGTNHLVSHPSIAIYPNPFKTFFIIDCSDYGFIQSLELMDMQGQTLFTKQPIDNQVTVKLDKPTAPGSYLLKITNDSDLQNVKKIIKLE